MVKANIIVDGINHDDFSAIKKLLSFRIHSNHGFSFIKEGLRGTEIKVDLRVEGIEQENSLK